MTPGILMLVSGVLLVIFGLITIVNFLSFLKLEQSFSEMKAKAGAHLLCGLATALSFLALAGGFVWFLVEQGAAK